MRSTFAFVGDTYVGETISKNLVSAGFEQVEQVDEAKVIFTYCISQTQLEDVYFESNGLIQTAIEGMYLVDLSPSTIGFSKEVYALTRVNEMQFADAPLVVRDYTAHGAFDDPTNLSILLGAEDEVAEELMPYLKAIASIVHHVGDPGCGQIAKSVQSLQLVSQLVSLIEGYALSVASDADASPSLDAAVSDGLLPARVVNLYQAIIDRHFHSPYVTQVMMAELSAALNSADDIDMVLPQAEACLRLFELFAVVGGSDMSVPALSLVYADQEAADKFGLDWSRAEDIYSHDHVHDENCDHDHDHDHDEDEFDDYGGFGGYSSN